MTDIPPTMRRIGEVIEASSTAARVELLDVMAERRCRIGLSDDIAGFRDNRFSHFGFGFRGGLAAATRSERQARQQRNATLHAYSPVRGARLTD